MANIDILDAKTFAKQLNNLTFTDYYYRLMLLSRSVFKWENLPPGMDEKWIERYLYLDGQCVFFKDKTKGFMVTRCTPSGVINNYDEPTRVRAYGTNYRGVSLEVGEECVLIRNNDEMIPTSFTAKLYAYRLADITRTIDVNVNAMKTSGMILCSEKQKNTMKQIFAQWNGNEPLIFGDKNLDMSGVTALKLDAPIVFPQLQIQKHEIWNEYMTHIGINNANMDKRERLVANEVEANNEQIETSGNVFYKARNLACKQINEKYDLDIKVSINNEIRPIFEDEEGIAE